MRFKYVARLDDGSEVARGEPSIRVGSGAVCEALSTGVVGMRVGDVRRLRAAPTMQRGKALAAAPSHAVRVPSSRRTRTRMRLALRNTSERKNRSRVMPLV